MVPILRPTPRQQLVVHTHTHACSGANIRVSLVTDDRSCATRAARNSLAFQAPAGRQERTHSRLGRWFDGNIPTVFTLPQQSAPISDAKPAANEATKLIFSIHCWSSLYSHLYPPSPLSHLVLSFHTLSCSSLFVQLRWCRIPAPICKKIRILNAI